MTDPVQQVAVALSVSHEEALGVLDAWTDRVFQAPRNHLGRVARIFHRRGMWSLSADMLAQSGDTDDSG